MRNILLVLLLANILVLFWYNWVETSPYPDRVVDVETAAVGLSVRPPKVLTQETEMPIAQPPVCFFIETQLSKEAAEKLLVQFAEAGVIARLIENVRQTPIDYWVRIDGFSAISAAQAAVADLHAGGLLDSYVMRDEGVDNVYLVSLGIYRNREGADSIVRAAADLGFSAVLQPRFEVLSSYSLQLVGTEPELRAGISAANLAGSYLPCEVAPADGVEAKF